MLTIWSLGYTALLYWSSIGQVEESWAVVEFGASLVSALVGLLMTTSMLPKAWTQVLVAFGWSACALWVVVAPTNLVMQLVFGAVTDWGAAAVHGYAFIDGLLWGWGARAYQRRYGPSRDRRVRTHVADAVGGWVRPRRWMRRMAWIAAVTPIIGFTVPHWLWALGLPVGTTQTEDLDAVAPWLWALGAGPLIGAVLTLGLARGWGQRFPSWAPLVGGQRVPRWLALLPALFVAVMLAHYGAMMTLCSGATVLGLTQQCYGANKNYLAENWAFTSTYPVFLAWGLSLGTTALGYFEITQERCRSCRSPVEVFR